jgi:hypothetical protein
MLFHADDNDIDLRVSQHSDGWILAGQVLGECAQGRVELVGEQDEVGTELNDLCEFVLPSVPDGRYTLRLYLNEMEIDFPAIELRA